MKNTNPFNVQTGDIWEEVDSRFNPPRRVKVFGVGKDCAAIITIGALYKTRMQKALLSRFDGKSHNYRLIRRTKKNKGGEMMALDTHIGNRSDAIQLITEMLEKADRKDGGIIADIKEGLEALLDAIQREVV